MLFQWKVPFTRLPSSSIFHFPLYYVVYPRTLLKDRCGKEPTLTTNAEEIICDSVLHFSHLGTSLGMLRRLTLTARISHYCNICPILENALQFGFQYIVNTSSGLEMTWTRPES